MGAIRSLFALLPIVIVSMSIFSCKNNGDQTEHKQEELKGVSLVVLGTIQDAGSPQIGCQKDCCKDLFEHPDHSRKVVCLGILDPETNKKFIFEATPDFVSQIEILNNRSGLNDIYTPDGIFLTHAHIGHYTGLMHLGKEAMNASNVPVYCMPRMQDFLTNNGPWSQLVTTNNIEIHGLKENEKMQISKNLWVTPLTVPHRDEYSETVGFEIQGPTKKVLFIPDIDKWDKWEFDIKEKIQKVDYAFLDATFYDGNEINNRDISEIPHPFVIESMQLFDSLPKEERQKIHFIHFNHTNPLINRDSEQYQNTQNGGYNVAQLNDTFKL